MRKQIFVDLLHFWSNDISAAIKEICRPILDRAHRHKSTLHQPNECVLTLALKTGQNNYYVGFFSYPFVLAPPRTPTKKRADCRRTSGRFHTTPNRIAWRMCRLNSSTRRPSTKYRRNKGSRGDNVSNNHNNNNRSYVWPRASLIVPMCTRLASRQQQTTPKMPTADEWSEWK